MTEAQISDYEASPHKTAHRLLHDALSKEDYARVLVNMRNGILDKNNFFQSTCADYALVCAFDWSINEDRGYWVDIYRGLRK